MGCAASIPQDVLVAEVVSAAATKVAGEQAVPNESSSGPPVEAPLPRSENDWIAPGKPAKEEERLALLRALGILDTDRHDDRFKDITRLICSAFDVPIAAVSLVDQERQWFKSAEGLGDACETGRDVSFCGHAILPTTAQILIVEDALQDPRFSGNPLVTGPPHIRFYAGAPLMSSVNGHRYGSLCVIDTKPHRDFTTAQYNLLAQFAELTVREIEKDKLSMLQKMVATQQGMNALSNGASPLQSLRSSTTDEGLEASSVWGLTRAADCFLEGVLLVDISKQGWPVKYTNSAFTSALGVPRDEAISQGFWELFGNGRGDRCSGSEYHDAIAAGEAFSVTASLQSIYTQTPKIVAFDFRPASTTQLDNHAPGVPASVQVERDVSRAMNGGAKANANVAAAASPSSLPILYFAIAEPTPRVNSRRSSSIVNPVRTGNYDKAEARTVSQETARAMFGNASLPSPPGVPNVQKSTPSAFDDVRLGPLIGRGAYGRVYRGSWNGNTVAVKVMETKDAITTEQQRRASVDAGTYMNKDDDKSHPGGTQGLFEALLSSSLSHPNIVHTYQYAVRPLPQAPPTTSGSAGVAPRSRRPINEVWIISEYCNRGPLLTSIERGLFLTQPSAQYGQPNLISVLQTLQEIAAAMQYLHSHHIIHGDLTGGNVLLTSSDKDARGFTAKVVDFGLSRFCAREDGVKTKTMGCAEYMPPELITGGILTKACDVYAFGVIIWEIYVGKRAWEGLAPGAVLRQVASGTTLTFPPQTPHRLRVLGEHCLANKAADRPTFAEVLSEVNAILGDTMAILQQFLSATTTPGGKS